jgi:hypothetical protein
MSLFFLCRYPEHLFCSPARVSLDVHHHPPTCLEPGRSFPPGASRRRCESFSNIQVEASSSDLSSLPTINLIADTELVTSTAVSRWWIASALFDFPLHIWVTRVKCTSQCKIVYRNIIEGVPLWKPSLASQLVSLAYKFTPYSIQLYYCINITRLPCWRKICLAT